MATPSQPGVQRAGGPCLSDLVHTWHTQLLVHGRAGVPLNDFPLNWCVCVRGHVFVIPRRVCDRRGRGRGCMAAHSHSGVQRAGGPCLSDLVHPVHTESQECGRAEVPLNHFPLNLCVCAWARVSKPRRVCDIIGERAWLYDITFTSRRSPRRRTIAAVCPWPGTLKSAVCAARGKAVCVVFVV